jgi:hypothetical protein
LGGAVKVFGKIILPGCGKIKKINAKKISRRKCGDYFYKMHLDLDRPIAVGLCGQP